MARTCSKAPARLLVIMVLALLLSLQIAGVFDAARLGAPAREPALELELEPVVEAENVADNAVDAPDADSTAAAADADADAVAIAAAAAAAYARLPDLKQPLSAPPTPPYVDDASVSARCPMWKAYDPAIQAAKQFATNCRDVALTKEYKPVFSVSLCESESHCGQGYFVVTRKDLHSCKKAFDQVLSNNEQLDSFLKTRIGPDAFHMIFDGPERASPSMWHQISPCVYKLPYRLTNPGTYKLQLIHSHTDFAAVDEVTNKWPQVILKNILPDTFSLSVCPKCKPFTAKSLSLQQLPLCSRQLPNQGVYLKSTLETEREKYKFENYKKGYIWVPLGCRYDQLFELDTLSDCHATRNFSMLMYGDSHNRVLWDAVDVRLAGSKRHLGKNPKDGDRDAWFYQDRMTGLGHSGDGNLNGRDYVLRNSILDKKAHKVTSLNRTRIRHLWGNYLQKLVFDHGDWDDAKKVVALDKELAEFDVFEFDWGHWGSGPEKNNGHFTVERYLDHLELASDYLVQINTRRNRLGLEPLVVIWQGVNSIPLIKYEKHDWQVADQDWRNNYRFKVWSMFAERAMLRRGFRVINSFDITFPWIQETEDANHVHTLPALDAQVDELLHKLNICNYSD
ncbi:hypothetical protein BDR26DRAFT_863600 [Obelidium mucronatum]|nr:hypothetical protein BDR26DRAFT_863600 [Obelidium mucronatum]